MTIKHAAVCVLAVVAATLAATVPQMPVRLTFEAIVIVATVAGAWRASAAAAMPVAETAAAPADVALYQRDRRNPIIERESGLFVDWYLRLRLEEEVARATRFREFFCVALIQAEPADKKAVLFGVKSSLRKVDYAADLGGGVAVVLPNTDRAGAEVWRTRLPSIARIATLAEFPTDGSTVSALLGEETWAFRPIDSGHAA